MSTFVQSIIGLEPVANRSVLKSLRILYGALLLLLPFSAHAQTLTWEPNREPNLGGYRVYLGTIGGETYFVDVGNQTSWSLGLLDRGYTYWFAVSAYTQDGVESAASESVSYTLPNLVNLKVSWDPASVVGLLGYRLTYGELNSPGTTTAAETASSATLESLPSGSSYYFYVTADLAGGISKILHQEVTLNVPLEATQVQELRIPLLPDSLDAEAPRISITSPTGGSTVSGTVNVRVRASDNVGVRRVNLLIDGDYVANSTEEPFTLLWDTSTVEAGEHTMEVRGIDPAGNTGSSEVIEVTVTPSDMNPPQLAILSPKNGTVLSDVTEILVAATDNVGVKGVRLLVDGNRAGYSETAPFTISWDPMSVPPGEHTLRLVASDFAGNRAFSPNVAIITGTDELAPRVRIKSPASQAVLHGMVMVEVIARDNVGVKRVDLLVDGELVGYSDTAPFAIEWDTAGAPRGRRTLEARAVDASGNWSVSETVDVQVSGRPAAMGREIREP